MNHKITRNTILGLAAAATLCAQRATPVFTTIGETGGSLNMNASGTIYGGGRVGINGGVFSLTPPVTPGGPWNQAVLYEFPVSGNTTSSVTLAAGTGPVLYGVTSAGGASDLGTVFSLSPPASAGAPWTETTLYSFTGGSDASNPNSLTIGENGILYGVTEGTLTPGSECTVFSLTPPASAGGAWTENVLYTFAFPVQPGYPLSGVLVASGKGGGPVLYGVAAFGGGSGNGMVFSLKPPAAGAGAWTEDVLYSFGSFPDGQAPSGTLVMGKHGVLYGTTPLGGINDSGTVFSLTPPASPGASWTEAIVYGGNIGEDFGSGNGAVVGTGGVLYVGGKSIVEHNAGAVLSFRPPSVSGKSWTARTMHLFTGADGEGPGSLIWNGGVLYGATLTRGSQGTGSVFTIVP